MNVNPGPYDPAAAEELSQKLRGSSELSTSVMNYYYPSPAPQIAIPGLGASFAIKPPPPPKPQAVVLSQQEKVAAAKAISLVCFSEDLSVAVESVLDAINNVRLSDPVGTVRREPGTDGKHTDKFAFAYAPGRYLLIDTDALNPAYKAAGEAESSDVKHGWVRVWGPDA